MSAFGGLIGICAPQIEDGGWPASWKNP